MHCGGKRWRRAARCRRSPARRSRSTRATGPSASPWRSTASASRTRSCSSGSSRSSDQASGVDYLSVDDLLEIAAGVLGRVEVRDRGLLASAAARPATTVFGADAYPRFPEKLAALMHSLARNHPLLDGNKRLAWSAARVFCLMNGRDLQDRDRRCRGADARRCSGCARRSRARQRCSSAYARRRRQRLVDARR